MVGPEKLIHEAFIYSSDEEFAAVAVPFLREAVVADQQAIAVTTDDRIRLLRGELGGDAAAVSFFDAVFDELLYSDKRFGRMAMPESRIKCIPATDQP